MTDTPDIVERAEQIMLERIQLSRAKGWKMPPNTVKVTRPGPWGNPFKVGRDGTREECVNLYKLLLGNGLICLSVKATVEDQRAALNYVVDNISKLKGKNLACWCQLDGKPCHADVLLDAAGQPSVTGDSNRP